ncbi:MAG: restriction endonuclease subunit S [Clostridium cochlearium]|uniref:restriction endonuclease subunit S n=1 Tax=Clostridium cochlearium TaxID=1494 RepID=UPI00280B05CC|nr:restriction endonuclease subunit S [Clostridium cochlearium]MDU1442418.1 restriction endonuclease subunit S [Clostridium cochlearium]
MTGEEIENGELRMESWKEYKIGDAIQFNPKERIKKGEIAKKIAMEKLEPYTRKITGFEETEFTSGTKFRNGDTLLARITPCLENGKTARVDILNKNEVAFGSTEFIVLREKIGITDNDFIYYLSISPEFRNLAIKSMNGSSGRQRVQKDVLEQCEIKLPSLKEQKAIAHILSTLDEKIETNNQINKKLEEMAQAIFKQWFVDFEFPCIPKNYKFLGAGKPCNPRGAGKPDDYDKVLTYNRVGGLPVPDGKSWFVYVLLCDDGSFYKGMTKDLYRRFYEHYTGIGAEWTKIHKPVKVIHYEKFNSQQEARKREEELKSGYGREWIKREYKKYQEGLPAHEVKEGLPAHKMKEGLSARGMKAGSPAHQTHLMIAGEMVESEMGMIPEGWEVKALGEVLNTIEAGNRPKGGVGNLTEGIPSIGAENIIGLGKYDYSKEKFVPEDYFENMNKGIVKSEDVLLYKDGAQLGRKTMFMDGYPHKKCCVNSHVFILRANNIISQSYLYFWLDQDYMTQNIINLNANSAQPGINQAQVKSLKILIPDKSIVDKFDDITLSLLKKIFSNCNINNNLTKLRDTLLPKLMSGEIRVPLE